MIATRSRSSVFFVCALFATGLAATTLPALSARTSLPQVTFDQPDVADLVPLKGEEQLAINLRRTPVFYRTSLPKGSIIIDTTARYLYFITGPGTALRYGVAVGRDGFSGRAP